MKKKKRKSDDSPIEPGSETVRDRLLRRSHLSPIAVAADHEREWLRSDGTVDLCVLNDLLCHLIMQNQMILQAMFPHGMPVPGGSGKTKGGIILPH